MKSRHYRRRWHSLECAAASASASLPPNSKLAATGAILESTLDDLPESIDFVQRVKFVSQAMFFAEWLEDFGGGRLRRTSRNDEDESGSTVCCQLMFELSWPRSQSEPYAPSHTVIPADPHPHLAQALGIRQQMGAPSLAPAPPTAPELPVALPSVGFSSEDVVQCRHTPVLAADLARYRRNPEPLSRQIFESLEGIFRIDFILTTGEGKHFYVVFADEAIGFHSGDLFDMLSDSEHLFDPSEPTVE
ncbi:hypothetical protein B0H17DRAFT_1216006 [Mycena rosella]|uniref:Uncharacterized protein n=1 Tax=Mycena rosella TaxID=1033263 RepID=A0AAD7CDH9_MYCRO|nr:hypothetical protein B0H17DRAFT_1216006 [Mycena rosella]